jgi:hypothetical protein
MANAQTLSQQAAAIYMSENDVQDFAYQYSQLQAQARQVEAESKDLNMIAAVNMQLAERLQGFLRAARQVPRLTAASPGAVLVSMDELRMLETESQLRLLRAEAVQQAQSLNLGNVLVNSLDQNKLQNDIRREVQRLNNGGGDDQNDDSDETQEEKNPQAVNLDKSDGLYSIIDAQQAIGIEQLIGYSEEANTLLNLTRNIKFYGRGIDEVNAGDGGGSNNRPIAIILYGPPGTGKTTSAQAVAKTLGYTYMYVNAENITSMWAGGTQKNIAKVFRRARIAAKVYRRKTLVLIDEVDGLLKNRQTNGQLTGEEYSRITTFLQMLTPPVGMDNSQLVCMFTTNNLENLDPAFVNRARQSVFLGYIVDPADRAKLFKRLLEPYVKRDERSWKMMADYCPEYVPRDIVNLVSLVRAELAERWQRAGQSDRLSDVVVPLDNESILLSPPELYDLTHRMSPATPVAGYFKYDPPARHVRMWLQLNSYPEIKESVATAFRQQAATVLQ